MTVHLAEVNFPLQVLAFVAFYHFRILFMCLYI